ncbi:MAG: SRPBCC family protein [Betaproteobacteria bacterium]|nr:SRPBCC family protein [Betaproteobacteria bacterium]
MKFQKMTLAILLSVMVASVPAATQPGFFHETVSQSITVRADPAKVWALIGDFDGIAHWNSAVDRSTSIDEGRDFLTRALVFKDDLGKEVDVLDERSDADMTLRYHVTSSPWPVTRYTAMMRVSRGATPGTSVVEWRGAFDVKGILEDPDGAPSLDMPPGPLVFGIDIETYNNSSSSGKNAKRDKVTVKIITDLYRVGLDSLKWVLER